MVLGKGLREKMWRTVTKGGGDEGWRKGGKHTGQERTFQAVGVWKLQRIGNGWRTELDGAGRVGDDEEAGKSQGWDAACNKLRMWGRLLQTLGNPCKDLSIRLSASIHCIAWLQRIPFTSYPMLVLPSKLHIMWTPYNVKRAYNVNRGSGVRKLSSSADSSDKSGLERTRLNRGKSEDCCHGLWERENLEPKQQQQAPSFIT